MQTLFRNATACHNAVVTTEYQPGLVSLDCPIDWIVETARNGAKRFDMGSECRVFTADRGDHARPQQHIVKPKG